MKGAFSKFLIGVSVLAGFALHNEPAQASCPFIGLPDATAQTSVTFTNGISYSLPILGLNYQSSPGQIQDCIVIQTGSGGTGINTNGPGFDNAYPAPNGTTQDPFNLTPYFSTAAAYGPVSLAGSNPSFAGQTVNTWDMSISALQAFLTANGGTSPVIMFNHNQTNSGAAVDQNLFIWAQIALVSSSADPTQLAPKYFYIAAETNPTGLPNFGLPGGSATAITGPQTAYNPANYPVGSDATGFPSGGFCGAFGAPDCGTSAQYMVDALGQICLNGAPGVGSVVPCSDPSAVTTINENLGADRVANAIVIPGLDALLANNPGYDTIQVALIEGCNASMLSSGDTVLPGSDQVPGCPAGSPLNNGFEQIFIIPGNLGVPPSIPEPSSLALLGSALIGFGWLARRGRNAV